MGQRLVEGLQKNHREIELAAEDRVMLDFAAKLTAQPRQVNAADIESLRAVGFCDTGISDIVQVTALFNYYNRIAEGLGIEPEPDW